MIITTQYDINLILNSSLEVYNCSSKQDPFILFTNITNNNNAGNSINFQQQIVFFNNSFMIEIINSQQQQFCNFNKN